MSMDDQTIKILIVLARYYRDASDDLLKGATTELDKYKKFKKPKGWKEDKTSLLKWPMNESNSEWKLTYEIRYVPGVFEIPVLVSGNIKDFEAFIALGCVVKGETPHFDFISSASINALMNLSIKHNKLITNGIITCLDSKQAEERANPNKKNKGGEAAKAIINSFGISSSS